MHLRVVPRRVAGWFGAALLVASVACARSVAAQVVPDPDPGAAGQRLFLEERYSEARPLLQRAAEVDARDWRSRLALGRIAILANDAKGAERWLEAAVKIAPDASEAHRWLAHAYTAEARDAGRFRQLLLAARIHAHLLRAVALDSANGAAMLDLVRFDLEAPGIAGGSRSRAHHEATTLVARDAYHGHLALALVAGKRDDLGAAERELRAALDAAPDSVVPYYQLGYLYQREQRYDDAFRMHEALLARHPNELGAELEVGRTAAFSGKRLERASAALERVLRESDGIGDPPPWEAHYWLGVVRDWQHDFVGAKAEYERALALRPDYDEAKRKLEQLVRDHPEVGTGSSASLRPPPGAV
ncbi:MAG TPA: tetratricopeptide repeat protein [Gemmatimonadaceae bacterium]